MINIEIIKNETIKVSGHANYAEYGQDIVCASVSTAVYMSINQIEVFDKIECINTKIAEGNACIEVVCEDEIVSKVLSNLIFTLRDLELQYPKYIKINEKI
jgi:uncharacterized protein YsxB (DUF464 family)